jgi:error-prone DNA polymerase
MGFKRSEERMAEIEAKLRAGMDLNGIRGKVQDDILRSIASSVLYGFPESQAASFALSGLCQRLSAEPGWRDFGESRAY